MPLQRSKKGKSVVVTLVLLLVFTSLGLTAAGAAAQVKLGNEVLLDKYQQLLVGQRVGLVTNQTGVDSSGKSLVDIFSAAGHIDLAALYAPEHGIDGEAAAGAYVESYTHAALGIPVYSLYGATRMPTEEMLAGIDMLVFDIQDIGARSYTYMSTMNYCMVAAEKYGIPIMVLDRPNPLGGEIVEGPMMEDRFISFVGIDNLPKAHGMTAGELARFFNRKIGAELLIVPMEGYTREVIFQDTGLPFKQTSPNIPDLQSAFGYMATGLGEGTGVGQRDQFKWIGGTGIDSQAFANRLNDAGLEGVRYIPEQKGNAGGVRLDITDYRSFNPARSGIYALAYANQLKDDFNVPKSGQTIVMFDKIMGTAKIGEYLQAKLDPELIEAGYRHELEAFKEAREEYLIYGYEGLSLPVLGQGVTVFVNGAPLSFDTEPYIDRNNRTMVPIRVIAESLGADVEWNEDLRQVIIEKGSNRIELFIDKYEATLNETAFRMDTVPVIRTGRTMVPLRFVGECLEADIGWDGDLRLVTVSAYR